MRKIKNANISQKDRIVCESIPNKLRFSYKVAGMNKVMYLFETAYSPSLYRYFHDNGRKDGINALSMTISQAYRHPKYNKKLTKFFEKLPQMIDYVLMEDAWDKQIVMTYRADRTYSYEYDDDCAA